MASHDRSDDLAFDDAVTLALTLLEGQGLDEDAYPLLCEAEAVVLGRIPESPADVIGIVSVLLHQGGERGDGADRDALINIRAYMRDLEARLLISNGTANLN